VQKIFSIKAKINREVIRANKDKTKLIIYSNFLNKIIKNSYNRKQENVYKTTQQQRLNVDVESLLERK